jgi:hypothetical protein
MVALISPSVWLSRRPNTPRANGTMMADLTGLPVNGDLEDGYGPSPEDCAVTVEEAIAGSLAGLGIEDTTANPAEPIHAFDHAVARMRGAVQAAKGRILLTGRTDNFINGRPDVEDTIRRLVAFAEVGADVLYAPRLPDMAAIIAVVKAVAPRPVNVLLGPRSGMVPMAELAAAFAASVWVARCTGPPSGASRRPLRPWLLEISKPRWPELYRPRRSPIIFEGLPRRSHHIVKDEKRSPGTHNLIRRPTPDAGAVPFWQLFYI